MSEQSRVKIVCPECGGPLPPEAAHVAVKCERCGHASVPATPTRAASDTERAMCPRCRAGLFEGDAHGFKLLGCGVCGGIFLDNEASTHITRAHNKVIAALAARAGERAIAASLDHRPHALPCPSCNALMRKVNVRGAVEVDICGAHGTWFDRGEVNRVMDAYAQQHDGAIDADAKSRAEAEARMVTFRQMQNAAIAQAEGRSEIGSVGVTFGVLGVLAALVLDD